MLKTVFKALFLSRKPKAYQDTMREEFLQMSEKAKQIAADYDGKINGIKEALVHLVGECSISMVELQGHFDELNRLNEEVDKALKSDNDEVARLRMIEKVSVERKITASKEAIDVLVPKIKELFKKKIALSSAQSETIQKAGVLEARARSSEAIGRANRIIGSHSLDVQEITVESLNSSVDKIEAYHKALEEVEGMGKPDDSEIVVDEIEKLLSSRRQELKI